ncbi:MAG: L-histidine N(alpha)-methyltransferase, partial [Armatimonadota bacterium]
MVLTSETIAETVRRGLRQRSAVLPSYLLYDAAGSALFERITGTPEYYPTRAETAILERHAAEMVGDAIEIVEFGSGSSVKSILLLQVIADRPGATYIPVDISADFLAHTAAGLNQHFPTIAIRPIAKEYTAALRSLPASPRPRLFAFLGSNVGNFEPRQEVQFLRAVRQAMTTGDSLLIGTDLVKSPDVLLAAYNDAAGVTAAFTRNLLTRMQNEAAAELNADHWRHDARWNAEESRMEIGLIALTSTTITLEGESFSFVAGDRIETELSHKYTRESVGRLAEAAGMRVTGWWTDRDGLFA